MQPITVVWTSSYSPGYPLCNPLPFFGWPACRQTICYVIHLRCVHGCPACRQTTGYITRIRCGDFKLVAMLRLMVLDEDAGGEEEGSVSGDDQRQAVMNGQGFFIQTDRQRNTGAEPEIETLPIGNN